MSPSVGRLERVREPLVVAGAVAAATLALRLRDPHEQGSWGFCPVHVLTGAYCPGCGGLRAVNDLTRGDILGAASSNLLFLLSVPVLVVLWLRWFGRRWRAEPSSGGSAHVVRLVWVLATVFVLFSVLRNLSVGSWLAP